MHWVLVHATPWVEGVSGLHDRLVEEACGLGREDVVGAAHGPSALPKDGDICRVSPKLADVLLHPYKGLALVPQTLKEKFQDRMNIFVSLYIQIFVIK